MRLYLVNGAGGGRFVGTQAEARSIDRAFALTEVPTEKAGLIAFLNEMLAGSTLPPAPAQPEGTDNPTHADRMVAFEDEWERFPLARKLHFAARAMEDARVALP